MRRNWIATVVVMLLSINSFAQGVTIHGGFYDDYLMISADPETKLLSGYYNDGRCRFYFRTALQPTLLFQRSDYGEAYIAEAWVPGKEKRKFSVEIYSIAKGGFNSQITLRPGEEKPKACRDRISLDFAYDVGNWLIDIRVLRTKRPALYQIKKVGAQYKLVRDRRHFPVRPNSSVWVSKTYSENYSPKGYVLIGWHANGAIRMAYVREQSLYPRN